MENLVRVMEIYCFKTDQDFRDFVTIVKRVQEFEADFDINIRQIPDHLERKRQELYELENEIMRAMIYLNQKDAEPQTFR